MGTGRHVFWPCAGAQKWGLSVTYSGPDPEPRGVAPRLRVKPGVRAGIIAALARLACGVSLIMSRDACTPALCRSPEMGAGRHILRPCAGAQKWGRGVTYSGLVPEPRRVAPRLRVKPGARAVVFSPWPITGTQNARRITPTGTFSSPGNSWAVGVNDPSRCQGGGTGAKI